MNTKTARGNAPTKIVLGAVIIGGSGVCNASCIHCPTNKTETDHVERGVMPMELLYSIVDQMAEICSISGSVSFGLYGDALLDPFIVERCLYVKKKFPDVMLSINTNAAAYSSTKHAALVDTVDGVTLHIESLRPDIYGYLMRPLRLERVLEKAHQLIRDFGRKVNIGTPLHRLNVSERQSITDYFLHNGCGSVNFTPVSNRCSTDGQFESLAFSPLGPLCRSDILKNFIIDWDGAVFPCCNDFRKVFPIGQLRQSSVGEVLGFPLRSELARQLDAGEWARIATCSTCSWDNCGAADAGQRSSWEAVPGAGNAETERLQAELRAVHASTSWRLTAPLRALRRGLEN